MTDKKRTMNDIAADMLLALDTDKFNWGEWDSLEMEFLEKLNRSLHVVRRLRADAYDCGNRAKQWAKMKVARETQADSFERHITNTLIEMRLENVDLDDFKVTLGESERIEIEPNQLAFLPVEFRLPDPKPTIRADKRALKKAITENGEVIPGVTLKKYKKVRF